MSKIKFPVNPVGQSVYYPSLDGLRFFAFFIVFLHHSLLNLQSNNSFINYFLVIIQKNGWVGVDLFFVLSGFLITNLLLKERKRFGNYSLKNFWIRRSLRIWPLYYLALFAGYFILPRLFFEQADIGELSKLPLYIAFLGNWAVAFNGYSHFTNISHLWTISVEEQFYFVWPILLLFITSFKKSLAVGLVIISGAMLTRFYLSTAGIQHPGIYTNTFARMDTLAIGALLALIIHYRPGVLEKIKKFSSPKSLTVTTISLVYLLYRIYLFNPQQITQISFGYTVIALFMVYFVVYAATHPFSRLLTFKPLVWMGKISYGLYVWHILAIGISFRLANNLNLPIFSVPLAFGITVLIGALSYYLYEIKFLKLKAQFTKMSSGSI